MKGLFLGLIVFNLASGMSFDTALGLANKPNAMSIICNNPVLVFYYFDSVQCDQENMLGRQYPNWGSPSLDRVDDGIF